MSFAQWDPHGYYGLGVQFKPESWFDPDLIIPPAGSGTQSYSYTATGGLQLGGTSTYNRVVSKTASGGLVLGGTATEIRNRAYSASGGIILGGTAAFAKGQTIAPSGGLQLGGTSSLIRIKLVTGTGGILFGGAASVSYVGAQSYSYSATGGVNLSGASIELRVRSINASGGLNFSGTSAYQNRESIRTVNASGGLNLSGAASVSYVDAGTTYPTSLKRKKNYMVHPFYGIANNVAVSASTSSASGSLPGSAGTSIKIYNSSSGIAFVRWGSGAQTAVNTDTEIAPGATEVFSIAGHVVDTVAVILSTSTGNVYFQRGVGA